MASLTHETGTRTGYRLRAYAVGDSRRRHSIWLGDMTANAAARLKAHVEAIQEAQRLGTPLPGESQRWLTALGGDLQLKLAPLLGTIRTVAQAVDEYLDWDGRHNKPSTVRAHSDTLIPLVRRFGALPLRSVAADQIDGWLKHQNVDANTVGKHAKTVKAFVKWCVERDLMDQLRIRTSSSIGVGKKQMISEADFAALIDSFAAEVDMAAALAIVRWSGVRVPSELLSLTRGSLQWEHSRLFVPDAKRSRRNSLAEDIVRQTPLFPELLPWLEKLWLRYPTGADTDPLLPAVAAMGGNTFVKRVRDRRGELGLHWPRLFTSLRATRETELIQRFGVRAACEWIGNSPTIARRNYEMITDETWAAAVASR